MQNTVTLQASRNRSPLAQVLRNLGKEKTTLIGLAVVLLLWRLLCPPLLAPYEPLAQNIPASLAPPSPEHWFGADKLGRDIFSRMIYGARISLFVGFGVVLMASSFGTLVGMLAGYLGGWWDEALMRVTDIFFAFPSLILAMAIAGVGAEPAKRADRRRRGDVADLCPFGAWAGAHAAQPRIRAGGTRGWGGARADPAPSPAAEYTVTVAGAGQFRCRHHDLVGGGAIVHRLRRSHPHPNGA
ncbi:MAG: ABC transporter permease [Caldilineaceae bacterium]